MNKKKMAIPHPKHYNSSKRFYAKKCVKGIFISIFWLIKETFKYVK